ncbi:MarR family transcriptional regulator [Enterobacter sp.]|uniref:MarR family transcriptional regulator n=1 Tax=Enterobacter sp. TaxID=42895 RepID=UPI00296EBE2F|nr:MarR family transcriptional regulator [Enterobacter sp.]
MNYVHGFGEMLRHLSELVDKGSEKTYPDLPVNYRSRYTPVLRAIVAGATTVSEIKSMSFLTQGAVSQTVALMEQDGIIEREPMKDGRKNALQLTLDGRIALSRLELHWQAIFLSVSWLDKRDKCSLMEALERRINALSKKSVEERIREAKAELQKREGEKHAR